MGGIDIKDLHELIDKFIKKEIGGDAFEKLYSNVFDFEDTDIFKSDMAYFSSIRDWLEHYSSSEKDLKVHSDYYISEDQLRAKITQLKRSRGSH